MLTTWWFLWMIFLLMFLFPPLGYGWGFRGWGPPYPRYVQRRRGARAAASDAPAFDHHAWGWAGDFVWVVLFVGMIWFVAGVWRH
jgi:hypothetical protein